MRGRPYLLSVTSALLTVSAATGMASMEHTMQTYYNMETAMHEFVHRLSVVFCDMSAEEDYLRIDVQFPADDKDRLDSFDLVKVTGNLYTYELKFTKFSGETFTKTLKANTAERTVELS